MPCATCGKPMKLASGQIAFTHRACRKLARQKGLKNVVKEARKTVDNERRLAAIDEVIHTSRGGSELVV